MILEQILCYAKEYKPFLDIADTLFKMFIAWGLFKIANSNLKLAKEQHHRSLYKISSDERELFRSNYKMVTDALGYVFRKGRVEDDARDLFWRARDQARLELPEDIQIFTEEVFDLMWKNYTNYHYKIYNPQGEPINHPERIQAIQENLEIMQKILELKPSDIYSKYLKIKKKT